MNRYFARTSFIIGAILLTTSIFAQRGNGKKIQVMNFNLWLGGDGCGLSKDNSIRFQLEASLWRRMDSEIAFVKYILIR